MIFTDESTDSNKRNISTRLINAFITKLSSQFINQFKIFPA